MARTIQQAKGVVDPIALSINHTLLPPCTSSPCHLPLTPITPILIPIPTPMQGLTSKPPSLTDTASQRHSCPSRP
ncbi:unnamed protein product [Closterium sp. NIES-53]